LILQNTPYRPKTAFECSEAIGRIQCLMSDIERQCCPLIREGMN
jgi:hypothetical protein